MAKFSMKQGGKEVGPASTYAMPHTSEGKAMPKAPEEFGTNPGYAPNRSKLETLDMSVGHISKSAGDEPIKTNGIKIRGTGAATKGTMARGPMA
jgi:hypothetical protein